MKRVAPVYSLILFGSFVVFLLSNSGCANIIPPTGGARDTIPPILIAESPMDSAKNVTTNRITFVFNEFIELQNIQENVLVSPNPVNIPAIDYKLRTVTVRFRDSLEPNTTYSLNFGNAIRDINEGNIFKDFSYVFSTGSSIDVFTLSGKVTLAETGKVDSTLVVVLHKNLSDSAVAKERARYVARLDAQGNYTFRNLPAGTFALYALTNSYGRRYDDKSSLFAFADKPVTISAAAPPVNLFAYVEAPKVAPQGTGVVRDQTKILRYTTNLEGNSLDQLNPLQLLFNKKINLFDTNKIVLTNKEFVRQKNYTTTRDTSATRFLISYPWVANTIYNLIIARDAFIDSAGVTLARADTISFATKKVEEYGTITIRFNNIDLTKNPVLLLVQNEAVVHAAPITQRDYYQKFFKPGEYEMRILYDTNKNGKWDTGEFFGKRRQPELVRYLNEMLPVKANWQNFKEVNLAL